MSYKKSYTFKANTLCLLIVISLGSSFASANDQSLKKAINAARAGKTVYLMQEKLRYANLLLEGMMTDRYDIVAEAARALEDISREATWQALDVEGFQRYAKSFQNSAASLARSARKGGMAQNSLPYVRLTISCMECHELVRKPMRSGTKKGKK